MTTRRLIVLTLAAMTLSGPAFAASRGIHRMRRFDTDNDGMLDLAEAKKAASALFARLDHNHDGTLNVRELHGRLNTKDLAAADRDHDGTLTLDEYLAIVEQRFNAADLNEDGRLSIRELSLHNGRALARLLR